MFHVEQRGKLWFVRSRNARNAASVGRITAFHVEHWGYVDRIPSIDAFKAFAFAPSETTR